MSFELPKASYALKIHDIEHYTDSLFRFTTERPLSFRFRSGEFVMITLPSEKPIWRAYSICSPSWDERLEFFSIKVPDGPLTSQLQKIQSGDEIWIRQKSVGTLVHDALLPGKRLYLFSTGTGVAPFASIIRDPETYEKFDDVILVHTTRLIAELQYSQQLVKNINNDEMLNEVIDNKLHYYGSVTREDYARTGRITHLLQNGKLLRDLKMPSLNPNEDRAMICGSVEMLRDIKDMLENQGFKEGSNAMPGDFVIEKAFAE